MDHRQLISQRLTSYLPTYLPPTCPIQDNHKPFVSLGRPDPLVLFSPTLFTLFVFLGPTGRSILFYRLVLTSPTHCVPYESQILSGIVGVP